MAYSYQDFENAANAAGLMGNFSQYDLDLARRFPEAGMSILSLKQDYNNATTDQQRLLANTAANQIRSSYGSYTGGNDGSRYYALSGSSAGDYSGAKYGSWIDDTLEKIGSFGSFGYGAAPEYNNAYAQQQKALLDTILNREDFSWSKEEDPLWGSYKKSYLREGDRATANTLAQASAASGGRASSYAANAAAQAGDYYAAKLNDVIPALYQQAYDRYLKDYQMKLSDLGAVNTQEQLDYNRYLTDLGQYNTDRSQAYNEYLNDYNMLQSYLSNLQGQDAAAYSRYLDSVAQRQQNLENQLALARLGASYGDYDWLNALGITPADAGVTAAGYAGSVQPASAPAEDNTINSGSNPAIRNQNGNGWIHVAGTGRMSYAEVKRGVDNGTIKETQHSDGTYSYVISNYKE